jgi:ribosome biogenesis protein UTP30
MPAAQTLGVTENEPPTEMSKGEDSLVDSKVSTTQCKLAIDALLKHALAHQTVKEQSALLPDRAEQHIWLVVTVKKMFPERKLKPFKMCAHPLSPLARI